MRAIRVIIFVLGVAVVLCGSTAKANLISNGGFETGDLTGWTVPWGTVGDDVEVVSSEMSLDFLGLPQEPLSGFWDPTEGDYFAVLSSTGWEEMISQLSLTFTTPADGTVDLIGTAIAL